MDPRMDASNNAPAGLRQSDVHTMMSLIPWPYRWIGIAVLIVAALATGWIKGVDHVQTKWDAQQQAQAVQIVRIQAKQTQATETINHATSSLIARSDAAWRLRVKPVQADPVPGPAGGSDAAAPSDQADPAGRAQGSDCNPADGSADAIVILEWQAWARAMQGAQE